MNGIRIKTLLLEKGVQQKDIADKLGISKQNFSAALSSDDIRSSLIENIAAILGVSVASIYGEDGGPSANAVNNSTAIAGNSNAFNAQLDKCLDLLKEKDVQVARFQSEIETLLEIIKSQAK